MFNTVYSFEFPLSPKLCSVLKQAKNKELFVSPSHFKFGSRFILELYPNGNNKANEGQICLYLRCKSFPVNVHSIKYRFAFNVPELGHSYSYVCTIDRENNGYGWPPEQIRTARLANATAVRIQCEIEILGITSMNRHQTKKKGKEIARQHWMDYIGIGCSEGDIGRTGYRTQFNWHIDRNLYRSLLTANTDEVFSSSTHSAFNCKWKLELYPKGHHEGHTSTNSSQMIGIFLKCVSRPDIIQNIKCGFSFEIPQLMHFQSGSTVFSNGIKSRGYYRTMPSTRLSMADELRIACEVEILGFLDAETKASVPRNAWYVYIGDPLELKPSTQPNDNNNHTNNNNNNNINKRWGSLREPEVNDDSNDNNHNHNHNRTVEGEPNALLEIRSPSPAQSNTVMKMISDMNDRSQNTEKHWDEMQQNANNMQLQMNAYTNAFEKTNNTLLKIASECAANTAHLSSNKNKNVNNAVNAKVLPLKSWLRSIGMIEYLDSFTAVGFDEIDIVCELDENGLLFDICIEKKGHRLKIMKAIREYKNKNNRNSSAQPRNEMKRTDFENNSPENSNTQLNAPPNKKWKKNASTLL